MTRTTDDLNPQPPFRPLGEKVIRPVPAPPEWRPKPGSPGIEESRDGRLRTNIPGNEVNS
jgi:hypothetical protein